MNGAADPAPELIRHLERTLGPIEAGFRLSPDRRSTPFQIARFMGGSGGSSSGYCTIGLSRHSLVSPRSAKSIRLELLMLAPESAPPSPVVSTIHQVATGMLSSRRPILRGDVIGPAGPMTVSPRFEALYATVPVYFPDEFATALNEDGDPVSIAWLVPITSREAQFVFDNGWDAFESILESQDPDLTSFTRPEMSL
ncbi:suppressor of fused domain protein [Microbacterium sp. HJ5]